MNAETQHEPSPVEIAPANVRLALRILELKPSGPKPLHDKCVVAALRVILAYLENT